MCTVTIVPIDRANGGKTFRIAMNRDELRTRAIAQPPCVQQYDPHQAVMPIDPDSRGTWIGANDMGIAAMLLNEIGRAHV